MLEAHHGGHIAGKKHGAQGGRGSGRQRSEQMHTRIVQHGGGRTISENTRHGIVYGIIAAPGRIARKHHHAVAGKGRIGAAHIADARHEQHVQRNRHSKPEQREPRAPHRAVGEFIPQRQVEEHAEAQLGEHHHRHHLQTAEIARRYEIAQDVEIVHHAEKNQQREQHEIFHGIAVGGHARLALLAAAGEYERFVGEAERLDEHHHHDGYLVVGAVDAELRHSVGMVGQQHREQNLVDSLIHDSCHAQHEQRRRIAEHLAPQTRVEAPAEAA